MAPRRRDPATGLRAVTTLAAAVLVLLLSSSWPLSDAAAESPSPSAAPAPAPLIRSPPPRQQQQATSPTRLLPPPQTYRRGAHVPRAAPAPERSCWQRLNLGQKVGLALAAVAVAMQVAFVAFLAGRARQLSRAAEARERDSPARASIGGL